MEIDTDKLDAASFEELAAAKRAIDAQLERQLEQLTGVLGLPVPKKRGRRGRKMDEGQAATS